MIPFVLRLLQPGPRQAIKARYRVRADNYVDHVNNIGRCLQCDNKLKQAALNQFHLK